MERVFRALCAFALVYCLWLLIRIGYAYPWTGFGAFFYTLGQDTVVISQKTLWDWLGLLIIPIAIAISAAVFSSLERKNEQSIAEKRREEERRIADLQAQDAALESYLAQISTLMLEQELAQESRKAEPRDLARAWTLIILPRLDGARKGFVIRFLHEAGLLRDDNPAIALIGADLRRVDLSRTSLEGINLEGSDLSEASFRRCDLTKAKLGGANARKADFGQAHLFGADLRFVFLPLWDDHRIGHEPLEVDLTNPEWLSGKADFSYATYSETTIPPPGIDLAQEVIPMIQMGSGPTVPPRWRQYWLLRVIVDNILRYWG